jgi:Glycosyltransferase family 92
MRKLFYLILMLIGMPLLASHYKYDISACMIFRDEAPYLKEWIEFHRLVGIKHFYLYNNLSQDNYQEVLQPYIDQKIVELLEWPRDGKNAAEWEEIQMAAYNDGLKRARKKTKWLAFIDSDEFLFPVQHNNLSQFLKRYEKIDEVGGILVSWVVYGTSGVEKIPDDKLLIETLVYSAASGSDHFKTICRPRRVSFVCSPHYVVYKKGYRHCAPSGKMPPFIEIDKIRINHYWARDKWYLTNVKIPRRILLGTPPETCILWGEASNQTYDPSIFRFIEPLKEKMKENDMPLTNKR